jgi:hypothetical protein
MTGGVRPYPYDAHSGIKSTQPAKIQTSFRLHTHQAHLANDVV